MSLAENLCAAMKARGVASPDLGLRTGIDARRICRLSRGEIRRVDVDEIARLALALAIPKATLAWGPIESIRALRPL